MQANIRFCRTRKSCLSHFFSRLSIWGSNRLLAAFNFSVFWICWIGTSFSPCLSLNRRIFFRILSTSSAGYKTPDNSSQSKLDIPWSNLKQYHDETSDYRRPKCLKNVFLSLLWLMIVLNVKILVFDDFHYCGILLGMQLRKNVIVRFNRLCAIDILKRFFGCSDFVCTRHSNL